MVSEKNTIFIAKFISAFLWNDMGLISRGFLEWFVCVYVCLSYFFKSEKKWLFYKQTFLYQTVSAFKLVFNDPVEKKNHVTYYLCLEKEDAPVNLSWLLPILFAI